MEYYKIQLVAIVSLMLVLPNTQGWGEDAHAILCRIAQSRLSDSGVDAVKNLLPEYAQNDLGNVCSWADRVRFYLHFADTPHNLCTYHYVRDCKDQGGVKGRCVVGAIKNYTDQLLDYGKNTKTKSILHIIRSDNQTQALMFLSHFMGDVHQPLHVGFTTDRGANSINVHWYTTTRKQNLHHVWDVNIIETAEERFYDSNIDEFTNDIKENITKTCSDHVEGWETCDSKETACPDIYALKQPVNGNIVLPKVQC